jgi:glycosyltransferase involved in cell wall biosynthesis
MMRIGIEVRALSRLNSGIGNLTYNVVKNLLEIDQENQYFLYTCRDFDQSFLKGFPNVKIKKFAFPNGTLWIQAILPFQIAKDRIDVFHSHESMLPLLNWIPSVATVNDLISFLYPKGHDPKALKAARLYPLIYKKAKKLIAISQNTKEDLIKLFRIPADKIRVVYCSFNDGIFSPIGETAAVLNKYQIHKPYVLNVGVLSPRKNIVRLIEAYNIARKKFDVSLVIVGPKGWGYEEIYEKVKELNLDDKVKFVGSVAEEDLPALYRGASLFVYPSLYEGFGIPPLEAMACGTPVIASNTSSLPEVVGNAGILVDPNNVAKLADAMVKVISNGDLAKEYASKGLERVKEFSWKKSAKEILDVYKEVCVAYPDRCKNDF